MKLGHVKARQRIDKGERERERGRINKRVEREAQARML